MPPRRHQVWITGGRQDPADNIVHRVPAKLASADFFFSKLLPEKDWLLSDILSGKDSLMALEDDHWAA
ncbi:hypothetical protein QQM79_09405 [Marinobacteraceae bacterium S3BR75-40.1]